jgi:hypothetical protein
MLNINTDYYFFVGPPKTGTTWIYEVLKTVKEINLSKQTKELEFFNKNYHKGFPWYQNAFHRTGTKTCDISTSYFTSDKASSRIKKFDPNAKIIITIRDPYKRLISHYKHNIRFGILDPIPIKEAIKKQPGLIHNSLYSKYIRNWVEIFGRENVLILPIELLTTNQSDYIHQINSFLSISIDPGAYNNLDRINYSSQPRSYLLAKSMRKLRKKLNMLGMYKLISIAKKTGLKKLIYEGGKDIEIDESVYAEVKDLFDADSKELRNYGIHEKLVDSYIR